jgi:hypothetical protein
MTWRGLLLLGQVLGLPKNREIWAEANGIARAAPPLRLFTILFDRSFGGGIF